MSKNKFLTNADLQEYWEHFTGLGDDGCVDSDTDSIADPSFLPEEECIRNNESDLSSHVEENGNDTQFDHEDDLPLLSFLIIKPGEGPMTKNFEWKSRGLELNEDQLRFRGDVELPDDVLSLETPYEFFNYFFSNDLISSIVQETNLYAVQTKPEQPPCFTENNIKQYLGIIIFTSSVHMLNLRSFWSKELRFSPVADVMSVNMFEKIRRFIHFTNSDTFIPRGQQGHDRLHKIRPLVDFFNNKFSSGSLEQHLSIDERMCSTTVKHYMEQYMPMKLTGQGQDVPGNKPNFGVTSNLVLRLASIIPRQHNYVLYDDNYYTALPLMVHLAKEGIYSLGTIRRNRIPSNKLPTEATLKKADRGTSHEFVAIIDIDKYVMKDNKYVTLASLFAGRNPITKVKRFDLKEKKSIEVDCPYIITEYNKHMGGVDLLDSLMGRYKIQLKSRKWYMRIFYHLLDLVLVNSWLLYKRALSKKQPGCKLKNQAEFRAEVANYLCAVRSVVIKRGRPSSSLQNNIDEKRKRGPMKHVPPMEVRADQIGHWAVLQDAKMRCKYPKNLGIFLYSSFCPKTHWRIDLHKEPEGSEKGSKLGLLAHVFSTFPNVPPYIVTLQQITLYRPI
ncbi:piggyBac transposable element-derived protein 3-like [Anthonomus grandis grandis]|uniref:piggyBac transposable element-derived protein 3-like n=1 Tax=Anthonomus grandis grandis TaxID=2921223 RepID=UPI0021655425|nr:piggyBac transposable element-derived protein 3-like [Anthonomus grandis grandis]